MQFARLKDMGWYLVIQSNDYGLVQSMHKSASISAARKYWDNPHMCDPVTGQPKSELAELYHPIRLGAGWLETVEKGLSRYGTVYMNKRHGLWFGKNVQVQDTFTSTELRFPDDNIQDLEIVISKYPGGAHWYLTPSDGRVFQYDKFNALCYALEEANKHALVRNIRVEDKPNQPLFSD